MQRAALWGVVVVAALSLAELAAAQRLDGVGNNVARPSAGAVGAPFGRVSPTNDVGRVVNSTAALGLPRLALPSDRPAFVAHWLQFVLLDIACGVDPDANAATAYIDGSGIYGVVDGMDLRAGSGGKLIENLPVTALPACLAPPESLSDTGLSGPLAAPLATSLYRIFVAAHNGLCDELAADLAGADEAIFQLARARIVATIQSITYGPFYEALAGTAFSGDTDYQPDVDAEPLAEFVAMGWGLVHALWTSTMISVDPATGRFDPASPILLVRAADMAADSAATATTASSLGLVLGAMAQSVSDALYVDPFVTAFDLQTADDPVDLFRAARVRGRQLRAASFNAVRMSLGLVQDADLGGLVPDNAPLEAALVEDFDNDIEAVDVATGCVVESRLPGALIGETCAAVLLQQLERLAVADRFFFARQDSLGSVPLTFNEVLELAGATAALRDDPFSAEPLVEEDTATQEPDGEVIVYRIPLIDGDRYWLSWERDPQQPDIATFTVDAATTGFVGLGFEPSDGGMKNADMIFSFVSDDGDVVSSDRYSVGYEPAASDVERGGTQDVTVIDGFEEDGRTRIRFSRPLDTGDQLDAVLGSETIRIIFSYNPNTDQPKYHGRLNRGSARVNLASGFYESTGVSGLFSLYFHGGTMAAVWGLFVATGVFVARNMRRYSQWLTVHKVLQGSSTASLIPTVLLAAGSKSGNHVQSRHAILGVTIIVLAAVQVAMGLASVRWYNPDRKTTPFFPDRCHRMLGRSIFVLAMANIYLGIDFLDLSDGFRLFYIVYATFLGALFLVFEILKLTGRWDSGHADDTTILAEKLLSKNPLALRILQARTMSQTNLSVELNDAGDSKEALDPVQEVTEDEASELGKDDDKSEENSAGDKASELGKDDKSVGDKQEHDPASETTETDN